ncbi:MAG: hypothetical protein Q7J45_01275 [bacterium]|nr:hypothetical protein [bacterium]
MRRDYGVSVSNDQANELGVSLLRLARLARTALARGEERVSSVQARGEILLDPKTSA